MKKTIIAIYGTANVGKSMTLSRLGRQLQANGAITTDDISRNDYRAVFNYLNRIVGVQTFGDINWMVEEGLNHFLNQSCDIIAIASKTYGGTTRTLNEFARDNHYRLIAPVPKSWTVFRLV
ncbi:MAG: hypothetical protein H6577_00545 [Lewinellaceae bacterium]|nr:hypothetical protein [Lewinellaceae bacterium]